MEDKYLFLKEHINALIKTQETELIDNYSDPDYFMGCGALNAYKRVLRYIEELETPID